MSKLIVEDFQQFKNRVNEINPSIDLTNTALVSLHKKYLALLIILNEIKNHDASMTNPPSKESVSYLNECFSDIGSSILCNFYGLYKPSKMLLRSSIENLIKSLCLTEDNSIIHESSVYKIFDKAKITTHFTSNTIELQKLRSEYSILCRATHTGNASEMAHISFLKMIPKYEKQKYTNQLKKIITISDYTITNSLIYFSNIYFLIDYRTKKILNDIIKPELKRRILTR